MVDYISVLMFRAVLLMVLILGTWWLGCGDLLAPRFVRVLWLTCWFGLLITGLSVLFDVCGRWVIRWMIVVNSVGCYFFMLLAFNGFVLIVSLVALFGFW